MTSVACFLTRKPDSGEFCAHTAIDFSATRPAEGKEIVRVNFYVDDADAISRNLQSKTMLKVLRPYVARLRDIVLVVEMNATTNRGQAMIPTDFDDMVFENHRRSEERQAQRAEKDARMKKAHLWNIEQSVRALRWLGVEVEVTEKPVSGESE